MYVCMCVHVLFNLFCMIFISLSCSVLQPSASCGELTQFRAHHGVKSNQPGSQSWLGLRSYEMVLPGSGNVILIQPFSAQMREIKRRGGEEMERAHRGSWEFRVREISALGQSSMLSLGLLVQVLFAPSPLGGDTGVMCLTDLWWNGYWQAVCTMPWKQSEPTQRGRGQERETREHSRSSTAKRTVPNHCHFNEKTEDRCKQAKVRVSCSVSWAQTALLLSADSTTVNNMQLHNRKMWTVMIGLELFLGMLLLFSSRYVVTIMPRYSHLILGNMTKKHVALPSSHRLHKPFQFD